MARRGALEKLQILIAAREYRELLEQLQKSTTTIEQSPELSAALGTLTSELDVIETVKSDFGLTLRVTVIVVGGSAGAIPFVPSLSGVPMVSWTVAGAATLLFVLLLRQFADLLRKAMLS
jgi:hypothetical protein